jgi:hypothetical protein
MEEGGCRRLLYGMFLQQRILARLTQFRVSCGVDKHFVERVFFFALSKAPEDHFDNEACVACGGFGRSQHSPRAVGGTGWDA